jgi:hypothetical protein
MDNFQFFTYRRENLNERGIYTRKSKKRRNSSSANDSLSLCNYVEAIDNCIEAASSCLKLTKTMFIIEKSSSIPLAKSVRPSPSTIGAKELKSPTSDQLFDCLPRNLNRIPKHENLCPADEFGGSESRSINEPTQDCRGKITFSSDFIYDVGWKENCKGSLFIMNDGEGGRQQGPCLLHNHVDLGVWRRVESFEIQFGWDRFQSLRLGYDWNWNCYTGGSGLNLDKFSKYPVRYINAASDLDSPKKSLVKFLSLREDTVTSVDMVWDMGLSSTCTIDNTVRLWDIEVGKSFNKMMVNGHAIVGSHIGNNSGFLLNGIMIREDKGSLFVWDCRDFLRPLSFCVGNMATLQSVYFKGNKVCISDCFNERQFDLRMIAGSSTSEVCPTKVSSFTESHYH